MNNTLVMIGTIVSVINLPKAAPKFCDSSFILSTISVADLADILSGGKVSSNKVFLIFTLKSFITICDTLKSPDLGKGASDAP